MTADEAAVLDAALLLYRSRKEPLKVQVRLAHELERAVRRYGAEKERHGG